MIMWTRAWSEGARASTAPVIPKYPCSTAGMRRPHIAIQAAAFRRPIAVRRRASTTTGNTVTANENAPAAIQPADNDRHLPGLGARAHSAGPRDGRQEAAGDVDGCSGAFRRLFCGLCKEFVQYHVIG